MIELFVLWLRTLFVDRVLMLLLLDACLAAAAFPTRARMLVSAVFDEHRRVVPQSREMQR